MNGDDTIGINPGYVLGQLARALTTSTSHADADTRARAEARAARWRGVIAGLLDGSIAVGSRTPLAHLPAWVTLEVAKGGFATGNLAAGGPLQPHELAQLTALGLEPAAGRAALNAYYLGDHGLAALAALVRHGHYRIDVPEEGALLVVAWLVEHQAIDAACDLVDAILPLCDRLRFYPAPSPRPLTPSAVVRLRSVGEVLGELASVTVPVAVARMNEALAVWAPLGDRAVALFLETVEGEPPRLLCDDAGAPRRRDGGGYVIAGGWPCQRYPDGWTARARQLLTDDAAARAAHRLCRKPGRARENYARLRGYLERCVADPASLGGRDVGMIRKLLASVLTKRGLPDSPALTALRHWQAAAVARPTSPQLGAVLQARLRAQPRDQGLAALDAVTAPVTAAEAEAAGMPDASGAAIPPHLVRKLARCLEAAVDVLVAKRVITSSEVLARVLPQITAQVAGAGLADASLRRLHGAIYAAFRRRRSLLLLDLQHQVGLDELPWVAALAPFRRGGLDERERARQTLEQLAGLALASFPYVILPNKLLQELRALAKAAALDLPFVDEVAADIFMGVFSEKYLVAAQRAARLLEGGLYERYYGLSYARIRAIDDIERKSGVAASPAFAALCAELAQAAQPGASGVARNGAIIEQEQILTTHNLALLAELGLGDKLPLAELARDCFTWICRQHQLGVRDWHARLHLMKNSAYAWRQMIFFLALAGTDAGAAFLAWAHPHLERQSAPFRRRFAPALVGLAHVAAGGRFGADGRAATPAGEARRFLGWSAGRHWLMPDDERQPAP